ncbi:MAG: GC-type dockerin domain-anchored protein [Planctomycetota bacterium]
MRNAFLLMTASFAMGAAVAQPIPFEQITEQPFGEGVFEPSLSGDGSRVAFRSSSDLVGENPDRSLEVFVYDSDTDTLSQVTSTPGGSGTSVTLPMIVPDGSRVIFRSIWDFIAEQPGSTFQLWEVDVDSGVYRQITSNPQGTPVFDPRLSGDGQWAVFLARINPTGQNADGSLEVFRVRIADGSLTQISNNNVVATEFPDINGDGTRIVWGDRANYDGTNTNSGLEIWLWDETQGITSVTDQQQGALQTNLPRIDHAGRFVSFISLFDFSGSGAIGRKVHVADTQSGTIELITNPGVGGSGANVPDAEIAPDGSAVFFESNRQLGGLNPDSNRELWRYDIATGEITQATDTTGGLSIIQLSDDATRRYVDISANNRIAYRSDNSLEQGVTNLGGNIELYLSVLDDHCPADVNGDGTLNDSDFFAWVTVFTADPRSPQQEEDCDVNEDGICSDSDFFAWVTAFGTGC